MTQRSDRMFLSSPHMSGREQKYVDDVFATNWVAPVGPMVTRFEEDLARYTGIPHVAALSSGTAALHLALRLSGIGQGDAVWGATMTFIGGVAPICYLGAVPVFLDVGHGDMLLDLDLLERALAEADRAGDLPKVVISTDLYGHVVDGARMRGLADQYGFVWIADAAEAMGASRNGVHAGVGADFAIFSFNGNKIITTSGGGALASADGDAIERARFLSTQARDPAPHYEHTTFGYNYRLSGLCAAVGVGQLEVLDERVAARRRVHDRYRARLAGIEGFTFSDEAGDMHANRWLTTLLIDPALAGFSREHVRLALEAEQIESRPLWKPMHLQPVFAGCRALGGDVAERNFDQGLCLPSGSQMTADDVDRVVDIIRSVRRQTS
ncbi:dTDP-4-amino-4,6-dideoxygalactose transaminase [Sphingomonas endophytica]|uniref:dTDP-4-amino-4,6-dideoxygalactose transaminase n=2 Tax=Sphingomonas endophytica TaxID=869719 RepID=A0A7X0MND0_9SPHN|nr:dTDP-4-amino-4,6-dideoxygalactose transaminase [Sphingomonas endophytica]